MSLLSAKTTFDQELGSHLNAFFNNDPASEYYVNPLDGNGNLRSEEELRLEGEAKIAAFSNNLSNIIYNFIKSAQVDVGIPVNTSGGSGSTTGTGSIS